MESPALENIAIISKACTGEFSVIIFEGLSTKVMHHFFAQNIQQNVPNLSNFSLKCGFCAQNILNFQPLICWTTIIVK